MFELHPRLKTDSYDTGSFSLCRLLLARDANYPWFILVPQVENITEIHELSRPEQTQLQLESTQLSAHLKNHFHADKMNIAALGNVVSQLHIHHIVRFKNDPAWPAPIWGAVPATTYTAHRLAEVLQTLDRTRLPDFNRSLDV